MLQPAGVFSPHPTLTSDYFIDPLQLPQPHCSLQVRQSKVEPQFFVEVAPTCLETQVPLRAGSVSQSHVVRQDHAALARGNEFIGIEAEAAQGAKTAAATPA